MFQRIILLMAMLIIFFSFAPVASQGFPPEEGYFNIQSGGETVGAAGYKLSMSPKGWVLSGWTILSAKAGNSSKTMRMYVKANLDGNMALCLYKLNVNDNMRFTAIYADSTVTVSVEMPKESHDSGAVREKKSVSGGSDEMPSVRSSQRRMEAEDARPSSSARGNETDSRLLTTQDTSGTQKKGDEEPKTVEKEIRETLKAHVDIAPFVLDANCFPLWPIFIKRVKLHDESSMQTLPVLMPQIARITNVTAQIGHTEPYRDKTAYRILFSSGEVEATAIVDSLNSRLYVIELPRNGLIAHYAKECPDTTTFASIDAAREIELDIPESNIKCDKIIENPVKVKYLRGDVSINMQGNPRTKNAWQKFDGKYEMGKIFGSIEIKLKEYKGSKSWKIQQLRDLPHELTPFLETIPEIPTHNDEVKKIADSFDGKTVWDYIHAVNRWIADHIKHKSEQHNAIVAAATKRGDPLARARLFTAIMRTKGIPARVVGGIYFFGHVWVQHYWAEVWISPSIGWRPVDPSTGEDANFSAVHISLFEGTATVGAGEIAIEKIK